LVVALVSPVNQVLLKEGEKSNGGGQLPVSKWLLPSARLVNSVGRMKVDLLPVALDDPGANLRGSLAFLSLLI
jgi:hypothetical protein